MELATERGNSWRRERRRQRCTPSVEWVGGLVGRVSEKDGVGPCVCVRTKSSEGSLTSPGALAQEKKNLQKPVVSFIYLRGLIFCGTALVSAEDRRKAVKALSQALEHWRKRRRIFKNLWSVLFI